MLELRRELGDRFEHFQSLDSFEKSSYYYYYLLLLLYTHQ